LIDCVIVFPPGRLSGGKLAVPQQLHRRGKASPGTLATRVNLELPGISSAGVGADRGVDESRSSGSRRSISKTNDIPPQYRGGARRTMLSSGSRQPSELSRRPPLVSDRVVARRWAHLAQDRRNPTGRGKGAPRSGKRLWRAFTRSAVPWHLLVLHLEQCFRARFPRRIVSRAYA
jgi:hypothetical protein